MGGVQHFDQPGPAQPKPAGRGTEKASLPGVYGRGKDASVCELPPLPAGDAARDEADVLFSRYETLLAAGARLFRAQGYPAVNTSEIGKGAGIAGPGLYRSFSSKQAILDALIRRLDEWRCLECIRALRANQQAAQRLRGLVQGHVRISLDAPDLVAVSVTELSHASVEVRDGYLRNQGDREAVWIDLIGKLVPATSVAQGDCWSRRRLASSKTSLAPGISRATPESPTRSVAWRWRS